VSFSDKVSALAVRVAEEINSVRQEMAELGTRTTTSTSSINADSVDIVDLTLSGNITLPVPSGGVTGSGIQVFALADGNDRTLTFSSSYLRLDGIAESYDIPEDKILRAALRKHGSSWIVEAVGMTQ